MKILVCNEAHIGDLILSTSVLKPLKAAFQGCEIGFLAGSWAKEVVQGHRFVDHLHLYDQACLNRSALPKRLKKRKEKSGKRRVFKELAALDYDMAIDLHSYYRENSAHLLFQAKIPQRISFWATPKPFLSNQLLFWNCTHYHVLENHKRMLIELGLSEKMLADFGPCLEYELERKTPLELPEKYILIHVGTGEPSRRWTESAWRDLVEELDQLGYPMLFVGKGVHECALIEKIASGLKNALPACDRYSFRELLEVVQRASFVLGLESMAGHLAAAFQKPALLLYAGHSFMNWTPYSKTCKVIFAPECETDREHPLKALSAKDVLNKLEHLLTPALKIR